MYERIAYGITDDMVKRALTPFNLTAPGFTVGDLPSSIDLSSSAPPSEPAIPVKKPSIPKSVPAVPAKVSRPSKPADARRPVSAPTPSPTHPSPRWQTNERGEKFYMTQVNGIPTAVTEDGKQHPFWRPRPARGASVSPAKPATKPAPPIQPVSGGFESSADSGKSPYTGRYYGTNQFESGWAQHPIHPKKSDEELYGWQARKADSERTGWGSLGAKPEDPRLAEAYDRQQKAKNEYLGKVKEQTSFEYNNDADWNANKKNFEVAQDNYDTLKNNYAKNLYLRCRQAWAARGFTDDQIRNYVETETNKYLARIGAQKPEWNPAVSEGEPTAVAEKTAPDSSGEVPTVMTGRTAPVVSPKGVTSPFIPSPSTSAGGILDTGLPKASSANVLPVLLPQITSDILDRYFNGKNDINW